MKEKILKAAVVVVCLLGLGYLGCTIARWIQEDMASYRRAEAERLDCLSAVNINLVRVFKSCTKDWVPVEIGFCFDALSQPVRYGSPSETRRSDAEKLLRLGFMINVPILKYKQLFEIFSDSAAREQMEDKIAAYVKEWSYSRLIGSELRIAWISFADEGGAKLLVYENVEDGPPEPKFTVQYERHLL